MQNNKLLTTQRDWTTGNLRWTFPNNKWLIFTLIVFGVGWKTHKHTRNIWQAAFGSGNWGSQRILKRPLLILPGSKSESIPYKPPC